MGHSKSARLLSPRVVMWDLLLVVTFYAVGALTFVVVEHWSLTSSVYFISSTVSTVGYGDLAPQTALGQLFCCVVILVGVTLVFTRIRKYIDTVHDFVTKYEEKLFDLVGFGVINVDRLPIYRYSPEDVHGMLHYPRRYCMALMPVLLLLLLAFVYAKVFMGLSVVKAIYFTVVTCTTVGYGDFAPEDSFTRLFCCVFLLVLCIVVTNTGRDLLLISVRHKIRSGRSQPDVEAMLLRKIRSAPNAASHAITESEYIVEALLNENLVDRQVLLAVRRQYHWVARGGDGCRSDITAHDIYTHQRLKKQPVNAAESFLLRTVSALRQVPALARLARGARATTKITPTTAAAAEAGGRHSDNFNDWQVSYWAPKVEAARNAGLQALANHRSDEDPFAVERAARSSIIHTTTELDRGGSRVSLDDVVLPRRRRSMFAKPLRSSLYTFSAQRLGAKKRQSTSLVRVRRRKP